MTLKDCITGALRAGVITPAQAEKIAKFGDDSDTAILQLLDPSFKKLKRQNGEQIFRSSPPAAI